MATVVQPPTAVPASAWQGCHGRPWMELYGLRLRPKDSPGAEQVQLPVVPQIQDIQQIQQVQLSLIQQMLPEELLLRVLSHLEPYELGKAACVCHQWSSCSKVDAIWKAGCEQAFQAHSPEELHKLARYRHRWRALFLEQPHVRFDGVYVSRNTYIRVGLVEWRVHNPVHLVCYYRYLRFFPGGNLLYRTTPDVVASVAPSMRAAGRIGKQGQQALKGSYELEGTQLATTLEYSNAAETKITTKHTLRSTTPGANNRLDVHDIESDGCSHTRGKATYVFVPWEQVMDSPLNLPVDKMDFYVPG